MCSWSSEPESLCNNWRGWKKPNLGLGFNNKKTSEAVTSLTELTARCVASHIPFELVEHVYPPVPEQLQLRIAFWSFPDNEEDIRLYSCLANGSADEFQRGDYLFRNRGVKDALQIGFHLSAAVSPISAIQPRVTHNVAVTFDRRRISSCNCTCSSTAYWCSHVVAVCLYRIHLPTNVTLRAPVSESLSRLHRDQLQKFAQYLISELPQQILPTAQRLLDELLGSQPSAINSVCGAPDPTAGASINDQTSWYLDERTLHDNIKKILIKFCVPAPIVFSDVNYLSTSAPPAAAEWTSLLRPLRGREPEGMWNLLSIVREMFKRNDRNAVPLLEIITEECMACEQILVWWFNTKVALLNGSSGHGGGGGGKHSNVNSNSHASQHACSSLCDEIVVLWRLAALNPGLAPTERDIFHNKFTSWHLKIIEKVTKSRTSSNTNNHSNKTSVLKADVEVFTGFKPAIEACYLDWDDYPMLGITYTQDNNPMYHCPFTCFRHGNDSKSEPVTQVNSSHAVLNHHTHHHHHFHHHHSTHSLSHGQRPRLGLVDYMRFNMGTCLPVHNEARSSVSSEGFCENEDETHPLPGPNVNLADSDSQEGGGSDAASSSGASSAQSVQLQGHKSKLDMNKQVMFNSGPSTSKPSQTSKKSTETESDVSPSEDTKDISRRLSKDESLSSSNSDSPQSGDEYNVYYYDPKAVDSLDSSNMKENRTEEDNTNVFANIKRTDDPWDVLFARAEGLHAHGHGKEACMLGVRLAEELLANPPNLMIDIPPIPKRKGKKQQVNPASHQLSCLASQTLSKCAFLCTVLAENSEYSHLAFRVGLFGLEMARPPASTKPLEVKLANQEADLVSLLKRLTLGEIELNIIRERAAHLRDGTLKSRGEAMLPIMLASYIFDSLVIPPPVVGREVRNKVCEMCDRLPSDETLAFEAAVAALGLKANVSEADHPLLCEGTRRQRGEFAVTLLVHYKDDPYKIARIMDRLLDREVHQLIKTPIVSSYYSNNPPIKSQMAGRRREECEQVPSPLANNFKSPCDQMSADMSMCSRPQSSTSAELEQGITGIGLGSSLPNTPQTSAVQPNTTRPKELRYKGKRAYPSIPNQPSEASAHFMIELAKTVLTKAGGNSSTSLFTQPSTNQNHHGPHRALHMCAFQLGLYALGLHNCVSPNWLSRTYSSHVSWITGQATEIGASAISFLIDTWEGHLTPPEAVSIADRASRGCDPNLVRAAADLALSCLPHSHALNHHEIHRAIQQCKEVSDVMLEHACLTVENAAKGGGVYPEVLFTVAKHWFELYQRNTPGGEPPMENEALPEALQLDMNPMLGLMDPNNGIEMVPQVAPGIPSQNAQVLPPNSAVVVTTAPPPHYQHPPVTTLAPLNVPVQYAVGPYSFAVHPHHHAHHVGFGPPVHPHTVQIPPPPHMQMYLTPPQFQYPPHTASQSAFGGPAPRPPQVAYAGAQFYQGPVVRPVFSMTVAAARPPQPAPRQPQHFTPAQMRYLLAAYRVGLLALETLARRAHDDRPQAKYARNPPYGDDVKWLLRISKYLGTHYLHQLCICAVNSIVSPFVLHDVAIEAAQYLARNNPALVMQHLRTALAPLVQKCQQMYIQCMHQKLYHLTPSDYEDFVSIVCTARAAFQITPEGSAQFKEWLQSIRRSKSCKKDLWAQINAALPANSK